MPTISPLTTSMPMNQQSGFQFDSRDFAMTFASTGTILGQTPTTRMEEWEDQEDSDEAEEEKIIEVEVDPDLEDEDVERPAEDVGDTTESDIDGEEFEQYLFGENDD